MSDASATAGGARRLAPLALTVIGFVTVGGLWLRRAFAVLGDAVSPALVLAAGVVYGGWLLVESRVSRRDAARPVGDADKGTMEMAAAAKLVLLVATLVAPSSPSFAVGASGLVIMVLGAALRLWAVRTLGSRYSHRIRPVEAIVDAGPYAVIRHPAYLGTWLAHAGLVVVMPSLWSALALFLAWLPAVVLRVEVEDRFLAASPDYAAYATRVRKKLIPGVY